MNVSCETLQEKNENFEHVSRHFYERMLVTETVKIHAFAKDYANIKFSMDKVCEWWNR